MLLTPQRVNYIYTVKCYIFSVILKIEMFVRPKMTALTTTRILTKDRSQLVKYTSLRIDQNQF